MCVALIFRLPDLCQHPLGGRASWRPLYVCHATRGWECGRNVGWRVKEDRREGKEREEGKEKREKRREERERKHKHKVILTERESKDRENIL